MQKSPMTGVMAQIPNDRRYGAALGTMKLHRLATFYAEFGFFRIFKLAFWAFHF
jgi:hypothetical protein